MSFCAVSLPASSFLTRSLLLLHLLSAAFCGALPLSPNGVLSIRAMMLPWKDVPCCAFPFLLRDPVAVCAQTRQGAPPKSWDPVLPAREGSKTSRVGMTFTRACSTVLQGCQGKGIVLWFVLAAESRGFRQKMFIKNTHCKCYLNSPG